MLRQRCVQMPAGFDDLFQKRVASILDVAQIGGGLRPSQVAVEGLAQIQTQETGANKGKVVNAQRARVLDHFGFGAAWSSRPAGWGGFQVRFQFKSPTLAFVYIPRLDNLLSEYLQESRVALQAFA